MMNAVPIFGYSVTIESADEMADLLRSSSPQNAGAFATAAHERACWSYDDGRLTFWAQVVEELAREINPTEIAA